MRINSKQMFFGRANVGMQKAMNRFGGSTTVFRHSLNFPETVMYVRDQNREVYIQKKNAADLREQTYVNIFEHQTS